MAGLGGSDERLATVLEAARAAFETVEAERGANSPEARRAAQEAALEALGDLIEITGLAALLARRAVSSASGNDPWALGAQEKASLGKVFSPKRARTAAGRGAMRLAAARLQQDMTGLVDRGAANVIAAAGLTADAGYEGPLGNGAEAGATTETELHQGVNPAGGPDYAVRLGVMGRLGYHLGAQGVMEAVEDIPPRWFDFAASWMRRQRPGRMKTADARTIRGWALDDSAAETGRGLSLRGVFEQARQEGASAKAMGRADLARRGLR